MDDLENLRVRLHSAVDEIITEYITTQNSPTAEGKHLLEVSLAKGNPVSYRWPEIAVDYTITKRVILRDDQGHYPFIIGFETRPAFNKDDRGRWVVFSEYWGERSLYPVIEFTETDDGRYSAVIPNPDGAGRRLNASHNLPEWFKGATINRTDELFDSVQNGPSLRVVVSPDDYAAMAVHGYWCGTVRHRLPRTIPLDVPEVRLSA